MWHRIACYAFSEIRSAQHYLLLLVVRICQKKHWILWMHSVVKSKKWKVASVNLATPVYLKNLHRPLSLLLFPEYHFYACCKGCITWRMKPQVESNIEPRLSPISICPSALCWSCSVVFHAVESAADHAAVAVSGCWVSSSPAGRVLGQTPHDIYCII